MAGQTMEDPRPPPELPETTARLPGRTRKPSTLEGATRATPADIYDADTEPPRGDGSGDDPLIGQMPLGQYRIAKKLGEGGFGAVYLAEQLGVDRLAVIKVVHARLAANDIFIKRFKHEALALAKLDHHHLVKLYNFGELRDGSLFLAMEHGGDRTLSQEIREGGRLPIARALNIAEQICGALEEAHRKGVVHRDLKPPNIMLGQRDGKDWVKVVDVGIAKILDDDAKGSTGITGEGGVIGTPAYFSPEQARGLPLDGRSDLYSLGIVLYEMLTGRLPIEAKSVSDYILAHAVTAPTPAATHGVQLPRPVEQLIARALKKKPEQRFQTAAEMGAAIRDALAVLPRKRLAAWPLWLALAIAAIGVVAAARLLFSPTDDRPRESPPPPAPRAAAPAPKPAAPPQVAEVPATPPQPPPEPVIVKPAPASAPARRTHRDPSRPPSEPAPPAGRPAPAPVLGQLLVRSNDAQNALLAADPKSLEITGAGVARLHTADGVWQLAVEYTPAGDNLAIVLRSTPAAVAYRDNQSIAASAGILLLSNSIEKIELRRPDLPSPLLVILRFSKPE